ncbi:MAG TPA: ABC transporter ATP-binding protein [Nitrospira sp.]|nr:ABC transporter ATP-binding protein [Nitrospira sp.]
MADLSIDIRSLVKRHGATLAVDRVTLDVRRGEFFSILGPSGAGKTSLLRMLAGFETPDSGEILIDGRSMAGVPPNRRPVNLVFQSYALFPHLSVADNVAFGLEMKRVPRRDIDARVASSLELVRLGEKRDRMPGQLSGGEQQRVALARALVNRPAVVLLDEPLAALDQQLRQQMQGELKSIQSQVGITFVCVTHHQEEALALSDRLAVMHQGRVAQIGRPQEIYESPATHFVAQFIGTSNELRGTLSDHHAGRATLVCSDPGLSRTIRVAVSDALRPGEPVALILRPERVRVAPDGGGTGFDNELPGRVETLRYLGSEWHCVVRMNDRQSWTIHMPNHAGGSPPWRAGDQVSVQWNVSDGVVLPLS